MSRVLVAGALLFCLLATATRETCCEQLDDTLAKLNQKLGEVNTQMKKLESKYEELEDQVAVEINEYKTAAIAMRLGELERLQAVEEKTLEANLAAMTEMKKSIASVGSQRVAFNVYGVTDKFNEDGNAIRFSKVHFNIGDGYDTATGKFTSPVDGIFLFSTTLCNADDTLIVFGIVQNGNTDLVASVHHSKHSTCGSATVVAVIKAGDTVWVKGLHDLKDNKKIYSNRHRSNTFVGTLLGI